VSALITPERFTGRGGNNQKSMHGLNPLVFIRNSRLDPIQEPPPLNRTLVTPAATVSARARSVMESFPGEPFWLCDWQEVVFLHFEADPAALKNQVPFELDLFEGRAYVSLVAFTLTNMRPRFGGRLTGLIFKPFGTHRFLNVRTYVQHRGQTGIYFLAEWLDAPRLNLLAGPLIYGLPFRCGRLVYRNQPVLGGINGRVSDQSGELAYAGKLLQSPRTARPGTLDEFLLERYRAFTHRRGRNAWFPVWHPPWRQASLEAAVADTTLLKSTGDWFGSAALHSAHWSPGALGVGMGWQRRIR